MYIPKHFEETGIDVLHTLDTYPLATLITHSARGLIGAIVGVEIAIESLQGEWKVRQNQSAANAAGVLAGWRASDQPEARAMADLVGARAKGEPS